MGNDEQLTAADIDRILESLGYTKLHMAKVDPVFKPLDLKNEDLKRIEKIEAKLRKLKKAIS